MATVSYPGVYIEEFTPGPPIEGVGTSTAAFIGTAEKGPADLRRLHSWDEFKRDFGEFVVGTPPSYLAPAVYGFFLNGGTDCFVLRATTAKHSTADLLSRSTGSTEPVLVADAIEEGVLGDIFDVEIKDSSILADELTTAGAAALEVHVAKSDLDQPLPTGAGANRSKAQVDANSDFLIGETVVISATGATSREAVIKDKQGAKTLVFENDVPGNDDFANGSIRSIDLLMGQTEIRVSVPAGLQLQRALPRGTTILIDDGNPNPDVRTVETTRVSGADGGITLSEGLKRKYDLGAAVPTISSLEFDLIVTRPPQSQKASKEEFKQLSMHPDHPRYWGSIVASEWVRIREPDAPPAQPADDPRPKEEKKGLANGADDNRANAWADVLANAGKALAMLDAEEEIDLVAIPGALADAAQRALVEYCEKSRRFAILDSILAKDAPPGQDPNKLVEAQRDKVSSEGGYAALYYPWIQAMNPRTQRVELWPPSGHIAGLYARSDQRDGVHKAPANSILRGALGMEVRLSNDAQGPLNLKGINVLRVFPGRATPVVWGARTTESVNKYWQYVNIRRLFLFLEKSIEQNIQWAVFEPNNLALWQQLKRTISDFLTTVWKDGALFGATAKEAFYVRIDEALNPESERALGRLHIEIGVAPAYPAEFIVVRIGIWRGGSEVSEA
jgi:Bacteriophage tail sheath protein